jgi:hypothetical protein
MADLAEVGVKCSELLRALEALANLVDIVSDCPERGDDEIALDNRNHLAPHRNARIGPGASDFRATGPVRPMLADERVNPAPLFTDEANHFVASGATTSSVGQSRGAGAKSALNTFVTSLIRRSSR